MMHRPDITIAKEAAKEAAACAARLRLPLRELVWQGSAGELAGAGSGSSMDFQDHRSYFPGDDPRHINWAAFARTGNYTMKLFREEVSPSVEIIFDTSPSMFLDEGKSRLSCALLSFALDAARRDAATTTIYFINGSHHRLINAEEIDDGSWVQHIDAIPKKPIQETPAPRLDSVILRTGSMRVWISDLLFPAAPAPILRSLTRQRGNGIILAPFSQEESAPTWNGICDFNDVETGRIEAREADSNLRQRYLTSYRAHFAAWKEEATRHHLPLARVPAGQSLNAALSSEALAVRALEPAR